jgi:hypothetical protein
MLMHRQGTKGCTSVFDLLSETSCPDVDIELLRYSRGIMGGKLYRGAVWENIPLDNPECGNLQIHRCTAVQDILILHTYIGQPYGEPYGVEVVLIWASHFHHIVLWSTGMATRVPSYTPFWQQAAQRRIYHFVSHGTSAARHTSQIDLRQGGSKSTTYSYGLYVSIACRRRNEEFRLVRWKGAVQFASPCSAPRVIFCPWHVPYWSGVSPLRRAL